MEKFWNSLSSTLVSIINIKAYKKRLIAYVFSVEPDTVHFLADPLPTRHWEAVLKHEQACELIY